MNDHEGDPIAVGMVVVAVDHPYEIIYLIVGSQYPWSYKLHLRLYGFYNILHGK